MNKILKDVIFQSIFMNIIAVLWNIVFYFTPYYDTMKFKYPSTFIIFAVLAIIFYGIGPLFIEKLNKENKKHEKKSLKFWLKK